MVGGLYPPQITGVIEELLSTKDGRKASVLDIGSGSGHW